LSTEAVKSAADPLKGTQKEE